MPHFENIEKYEATNPKSGRKEIIPIAPHSLQAADYRPRKREGDQVQRKEKAPEFPEVNVEPISVTQMEKEFRMASRRAGRTRPKGQSLWSRLMAWISSRTKKREDSRSPGQGRPRRNRPNRGRNSTGKGKSGQQQPQQQENAQSESGSSHRRRRRRRSGQQGKGQGSQQGGQKGPRQQQGQEKQQPQNQKQEGRRRNRNRRNRKRPGKEGGNQNSDNN